MYSSFFFLTTPTWPPHPPLSEYHGPQHRQAQFIKILHWHMSLNPRSRQDQFQGGRLGWVTTVLRSSLFQTQWDLKQHLCRSRSMCQDEVCERFAYPHRKTFWSNKVFHWFNAINGFFFFLYGTFYVDKMGGGSSGGWGGSEILQAERLSKGWCTKALVDVPRGGEGFWPNSSESRATSHAWYVAGGMPLRWRERTGEAREGGWRAVDRAHMLQRRVWVVIHPRRTARKVRSLWVWVGSHPRRTETLWFIYIKVYEHKETKFSEYMVCCFVHKVMKFGEGSIQTARVTGQKVGVCVSFYTHCVRERLTEAALSE